MSPRIRNWMADDHPLASKFEGPECFSNLDLEICDLEILEAKMAMPYITEYKAKCFGDETSTLMFLITNGRLGHSDKHIDDDDDFVNPQPTWKGTSVGGDLPDREHKSTDKINPHTFDSKGQPSNNARNVEKNVDSKGKAKVDSMGKLELPYSLELPSFDLDLGFKQPSQLEAMKPKEVQVYVDSVLYNVLKKMESIEKEVSNNTIVFVE
ncbi:Hypothetical predicted protein [Olea europaea subsp. europaea]|uniref:Uncharacterized protein n=1 Tax=Olea europaea subsp. europaea TaxID=158383 RepID=A0A8S0UJI8_OLEEU|nr:Hypothetical predicted protein [Olea europaea subsp. europaea]